MTRRADAPALMRRTADFRSERSVSELDVDCTVRSPGLTGTLYFITRIGGQQA